MTHTPKTKEILELEDMLDDDDFDIDEDNLFEDFFDDDDEFDE